MKQYAFIFSNERSYRLKRHLVFWCCWWVFCTVLYSFAPFSLTFGFAKRLFVSGVDAFFFLGPHIFLAYALMYFVIPRYVLKANYVGAAVATICIVLVTGGLSAFTRMVVLNRVWSILPGRDLETYLSIEGAQFFNALLAGLRGAITIGGLAAAIKLMKYWYVKEQKNLQLQKQNVETQLQLLKAQIHPHFLFNTLNNIYSHTQVASAEAPKLVMGLSNMLRYMLYECNQPLAPLDKELKMLQDYIMLEQIRYNYQLELTIDLPKETNHLQIAPLLLLPFVENCFKHGTSQMLENPWVSLVISIDAEELKMKLVNGKAAGEKNTAKGIGIYNVQKRLQLLYPEKHLLRITETDDAFIVTLKMELEKQLPHKSPIPKTLVNYD